MLWTSKGVQLKVPASWNETLYESPQQDTWYTTAPGIEAVTIILKVKVMIKKETVLGLQLARSESKF